MLQEMCKDLENQGLATTVLLHHNPCQDSPRGVTGCECGPRRLLSLGGTAPTPAMNLPARVLSHAHLLQHVIDTLLGVALVGESVVRSIEGRGPGHDHVEVQPTDQLQALYVVLAIARSEQRRHPRAVFENDGVSGEQDTMLSRIPEKRRRPARVAGDGYDLEVISEGMPLGEGPVQFVGSRDLFLLVLVGIKRRTEGARDPRACRLGDPRFVPVVQGLKTTFS